MRLDDISKLYDASRHPDVVEGRKTPEQVFSDFMAQRDTQVKNGVVTFEEFCDYYADVSSSVDSD